MKDFEFEEQEETVEDLERIHLQEKSKRASRRHHLKRMKDKARRKYKDWNWINSEDAEKFAVKSANHLANCSCYACGNPRHHLKGKDKVTKQEIIADEAMKEQLDEI